MPDEAVYSIDNLRRLTAIDPLPIEPVAFYFPAIHRVRVVVPIIARIDRAAMHVWRPETLVGNPIRREKRCRNDCYRWHEAQQRLPRCAHHENQSKERKKARRRQFIRSREGGCQDGDNKVAPSPLTIESNSYQAV